MWRLEANMWSISAPTAVAMSLVSALTCSHMSMAKSFFFSRCWYGKWEWQPDRFYWGMLDGLKTTPDLTRCLIHITGNYCFDGCYSILHISCIRSFLESVRGFIDIFQEKAKTRCRSLLEFVVWCANFEGLILLYSINLKNGKSIPQWTQEISSIVISSEDKIENWRLARTGLIRRRLHEMLCDP